MTAENWGPGVSRVLSALARQFTSVVWQADKPPTDAELNLISQVEFEALSQTVRAQVHSGFFLDPTRTEQDYLTDPLYANQFVIAPPATVGGTEEASPVLLAAVNGWVIPVAGSYLPESAGPDEVANRVRLFPPPTTDARSDLVFLEVWRALVSANPSTTNKPSAGFIWKNGNTQYGGTNVTDDLEDPSLGFETTKRVQLQYRIRVVGSGDAGGTSVDLANFPDGLTDPQVLAQGTTVAPVGGAVFTNMRQELGDPSLWRAGSGDPANALGTVDGYVYAIPMCAVFRRNTGAFTAVANAGNPNQNGAAERTPASHALADPQSGARTLALASLTAALLDTTTGWVTLTNYSTSALGDADLFPIGTTRRYLVIGEGIDAEVIAINVNSDPGGHPSDIFIDAAGRGRAGTMAKYHAAGSALRLYNTNPDGLYADQIDITDIIDLRRSVNFGDWDYTRLLQNGVAALVQNNLHSSWKKAGTGGDTVGTVTTEVSYLQAPSAVPFPAPTQVDVVDGPDGIRTVWSDSAAIQGDITNILDPGVTLDANHITATTFDATVSSKWAVGADFQPHGFLNLGVGVVQGWTNGSVIFMDIGGATGNDGAHAGLVGGQESVRFLSPAEVYLQNTDSLVGTQYPWKLRFVGGVSGNGVGGALPTESQNGYRAAMVTSPGGFGEDAFEHPGPMYPLAATNFESPFIVLGGILNAAVAATVVANAANFVSVTAAIGTIRATGLDFNTVVNLLPLGRSVRTLRDILTNDGKDITGSSSGLYIVVYGDKDSQDNNGAFQVIGAGTAAADGGSPYTDHAAAANADSLIVRPLSADWIAFDNTGNIVTIEFRSQEINAEDDNGSTNPPSGVAVVLTDMRWSGGTVFPPTNPIATADAPATTGKLVPIDSRAVITTNVMWSPNRGASTRVPDQIVRFSAKNSAATFVRNDIGSLDPVFVTETGYPSGDRVYGATQVQLWNRLPSKGMSAPALPSGSTTYGGVVVGLTEQDREAEVFVDPGSKTVIFRPLIKKPMILKGLNAVTTVPSLIGALDYPGGGPLKDNLALFTPNKTLGYALPPEYAPRFGRQDIPYHTYTGGTDPIYPGINHLFADGSNASSPTFYIIGGKTNPGPPGSALVQSILFSTNNGAILYGQSGTVGGAPHSAYGARKQFLSGVVSSDLGVGMHGIELPPYHGIARLYGVYEYNDFLNNLDPTYIGGFQNDRLTRVLGSLSGVSAVNLLRTGASKQTLFIRQGGGNDTTNLQDSHTYIVPDSAIDISLAPAYTGVETFDSFNYVVECVVFGFAEGFINKNNYVLARRSTGTGIVVVDTDTYELIGVDMILPAASPRGDALYEVYNRTVYQGDPYMTRDGSTLQEADYMARYGQIPQASAVSLGTTIQQFDSVSGAMTVTRPNARALEVLASMDFYTTLGTGKIGGSMWSGTSIDCGFTDPVAGRLGRLPTSGSDPAWRVLPMAFTQGQEANDSFASVSVTIRDYLKADTGDLKVALTMGLAFLEITAPFSGPAPASNEDMASNLANTINGDLVNTAPYVRAEVSGATVTITAKVRGSLGNTYRVALRTGIAPTAAPVLTLAMADVTTGPTAYTSSFFSGGVDVPVNGGLGNSVISLTGMTERLPLGILVSDSDFLSENILNDTSTSLRSYFGGVRSVYANVPLTSGGFEYTRFLGEPGAILAMSDGGVLQYTPYTLATPGGSHAYRIFRGGGAAFMLSGVAPGGPLTWASDTFQPALQPVLKGAVLSCKALLVRNYHEDAFGVASTRTEGDEIQMLILTQAIYGTPSTATNGVALSGIISPTGYGEGLAASDRYRLPGRPMDRGRTRTAPDPTTQPAPFTV